MNPGAAWSLLGCLIGIGLAALINRAQGNAEKYDERQTAARGAAFEAGFFTFLFYEILRVFLARLGVVWCGEAAGAVVGIVLAMTVFSGIAVCRDAFVGLNRRMGASAVVSLVVGLPSVLWGVTRLKAGIGFDGGKLTDGNDILFLGAYLCVVGVLMLVKWLIGREKKKGDYDE